MSCRCLSHALSVSVSCPVRVSVSCPVGVCLISCRCLSHVLSVSVSCPVWLSVSCPVMVSVSCPVMVSVSCPVGVCLMSCHGVCLMSCQGVCFMSTQGIFIPKRASSVPLSSFLPSLRHYIISYMRASYIPKHMLHTQARFVSTETSGVTGSLTREGSCTRCNCR
jgi:hypothetical protein